MRAHVCVCVCVCMCVCVCVLGSGRSEIALHQGKRCPRDVEVKAMEGLDNWESNVMKEIGENGVKNAGERLSFSSLIVASKFLEKKKILGKNHKSSYAYTKHSGRRDKNQVYPIGQQVDEDQ